MEQQLVYIDDNNVDTFDNNCMSCAYNTVMSFTLVILIVLLVVYFMIIIIIYYGNKYSINLLFNLMPSKYKHMFKYTTLLTPHYLIELDLNNAKPTPTSKSTITNDDDDDGDNNDNDDDVVSMKQVSTKPKLDNTGYIEFGKPKKSDTIDSNTKVREYLQTLPQNKKKTFTETQSVSRPESPLENAPPPPLPARYVASAPPVSLIGDGRVYPTLDHLEETAKTNTDGYLDTGDSIYELLDSADGDKEPKVILTTESNKSPLGAMQTAIEAIKTKITNAKTGENSETPRNNNNNNHKNNGSGRRNKKQKDTH